MLNPGVKISDRPFTDHIDYTRLSKSCATCAKCNAVCPVYDVFRSEDMSSRGWFDRDGCPIQLPKLETGGGSPFELVNPVEPPAWPASTSPS